MRGGIVVRARRNGVEMILDYQATDTLKLGLVTEYRSTESKWQQFYNAEGNLVTDVEKSSTADSYTLSADWTPAQQWLFWQSDRPRNYAKNTCYCQFNPRG